MGLESLYVRALLAGPGALYAGTEGIAVFKTQLSLDESDEVGSFCIIPNNKGGAAIIFLD